MGLNGAIVFCTIFLGMVGLCIIGLSVVVRDRFSDNWKVNPHVYMAAGALLTSLTFIGVIGATSEPMKNIYLFGVVVAFVLLFYGTTTLFVVKINAKTIRNNMHVMFEKYRSTPNDLVSRIVCNVQKKYRCCGLDGHLDFFQEDGSLIKRGYKFVADCCCLTQPCDIANVYPKGCVNKKLEYLSHGRYMLDVVPVIMLLVIIIFWMHIYFQEPVDTEYNRKYFF